MNAISKYIWIGWTSARTSLAYAREVLLRSVFTAVILYIFLRLWSAVFASSAGERLGGLTLPQMLWYLMITEAFWMSSARVSYEVDEDVRTGRLAMQITKPLSYPIALLGKALGERVVRFTINLAVGATTALILVGPVPVTASGVAMFLSVLPLSLALDALGLISVGMLAFWFESTTGLALMYSRVVMLAGGAMLPLELYPEAIRGVLHWLPFAAMIYGPARILVDPSAPMLGRLLLVQGLGLAVFTLVLFGLQTLAFRRIHSHGG